MKMMELFLGKCDGKVNITGAVVTAIAEMNNW